MGTPGVASVSKQPFDGKVLEQIHDRAFSGWCSAGRLMGSIRNYRTFFFCFFLPPNEHWDGGNFQGSLHHKIATHLILLFVCNEPRARQKSRQNVTFPENFTIWFPSYSKRNRFLRYFPACFQSLLWAREMIGASRAIIFPSQQKKKEKIPIHRPVVNHSNGFLNMFDTGGTARERARERQAIKDNDQSNRAI